MAVEDKVKEILIEVLDVSADEIQNDTTLDGAFGVDSTEMVEISVGLKKVLNVEISDGELKKTMSFGEIVGILKGKSAE